MTFMTGPIVRMIHNKNRKDTGPSLKTNKDEKNIQSLILKGKDKYRELIKTNDFDTALYESLSYVREKIVNNYRIKPLSFTESPMFDIPSYDLFFREIDKLYEKNKFDYTSYVVAQIERFLESKTKKDKTSVSERTIDNFYDFRNIIGQDNITTAIKALSNSLLLYMPEEGKNPAFPFPEKILFYGISGIGKSFTVNVCREYLKAKSDAFGLEFNSLEVSPDMFSKYFWESEKNLKNKFADIKNAQGIGLIVVDEADTMFPRRSSKDNSKGYDSITGELLRLLDENSTENKGQNLMFFISNRPEDGLDPALVSRMELKLKFNDKFSDDDYGKMVNLYVKKYKISENKLDFDTKYLAERASEHKMSPRDLKNVIINIKRKMRFLSMSLLLDSEDSVKRFINMDYKARACEIDNRLEKITKKDLEKIISNQMVQMDYRNDFL